MWLVLPRFRSFHPTLQPVQVLLNGSKVFYCVNNFFQFSIIHKITEVESQNQQPNILLAKDQMFFFSAFSLFVKFLLYLQNIIQKYTVKETSNISKEKAEEQECKDKKNLRRKNSARIINPLHKSAFYSWICI